jgi:hypothetical protein
VFDKVVDALVFAELFEGVCVEGVASFEKFAELVELW